MSWLRWWAWPALIAALMAIGGCASVPSALQGATRAAPFDVLGRMLVNYDGRSLTANVRWLHAPEADDVWLMTPTGQALAHLRESADGAVLTAADQTQYRAGSLETLAQRALGWELPVGHLQHWVRGVPSPGVNTETVERDAAGRIRQLAQAGWRVSYDYFGAGENAGLPRRMEVVGSAQTLRLVIDTWRRETADQPPTPTFTPTPTTAPALPGR